MQSSVASSSFRIRIVRVVQSYLYAPLAAKHELQGPPIKRGKPRAKVALQPRLLRRQGPLLSSYPIILYVRQEVWLGRQAVRERKRIVSLPIVFGGETGKCILIFGKTQCCITMLLTIT